MHVNRDSKNIKAISPAHGHAHTFSKSERERIHCYLFQHACMHSRRIYSLWHVRVLQPLKTYQSNRARLASILQLSLKPRLARSRSCKTTRSFGCCDKRGPFLMNFAPSIPIIVCLATNYAFPFIFSS